MSEGDRTDWEGSQQAARSFLHGRMRKALTDGRIEDADALRAETYAGDDLPDIEPTDLED